MTVVRLLHNIASAPPLIVQFMTIRDYAEIRNRFDEVVNMTSVELEEWLRTDESQRVGVKKSDDPAAESVGHASGRRIVEILRKRIEQLTPEDYAHMRKVVGFVRRHTEQRPENVYTSRWRYSLMNWGHDPLKEGGHCSR
jgi:hypothetical protein